MDTFEKKALAKPTQLISVEKAKELHGNFNNKNCSLKKGTDSEKEDANAVWYSLQELESYIAYIKKEGVTKGYDINGIRFYFGSYSDNEKDGKAGLTTLFLSPTGTKKGETNTTAKISASAKDVTEVSPLNFGGYGNPPQMEYGG